MPVDDSLLMRVLQAPRRLQNAPHRLGRRQRAVGAHRGGQITAFHIFHHQEMRSVRLVRVVGGDDVRMPQFGGRHDLALETRQRLGRLSDVGREHLERDDPPHPLVLGLEHHPHAALAELVEDDVIAKYQILAAAREQFLLLVFGEPRLLHKDRAERFAIFRPLRGWNPLPKGLQIVGGQESRSDHRFGEFVASRHTRPKGC